MRQLILLRAPRYNPAAWRSCTGFARTRQSLLRANATRLPIEREVIGRFDNAAKRQFHLSVAGHTIVVVFDEQTSLGLVRLRTKKASEVLARLFSPALR
jgi:hypothetical protein